MKRKVKVGVSNRHVHLTEDVYNQLFQFPLTKKQDLSQIGDFAANETVTLKTEKGSIQNVRIIGPFRNYNQVEISNSDARKLGIHPPVRKSGELENSEEITILGEIGSVTLKDVCILSERHIHMSPFEAKIWKVKDKQKVQVKINGSKSGILDAYIKISENGVLAFHVDIDDANAFLLEQNDEVEVLW